MKFFFLFVFSLFLAGCTDDSLPVFSLESHTLKENQTIISNAFLFCTPQNCFAPLHATGTQNFLKIQTSSPKTEEKIFLEIQKIDDKKDVAVFFLPHNFLDFEKKPLLTTKFVETDSFFFDGKPLLQKEKIGPKTLLEGQEKEGDFWRFFGDFSKGDSGKPLLNQEKKVVCFLVAVQKNAGIFQCDTEIFSSFSQKISTLTGQ